jgi:hypothetical protein
MWKYLIILCFCVGCADKIESTYHVGDIVETAGGEKALILREYPAIYGYDIDIIGSGQPNTYYNERCLRGLWEQKAYRDNAVERVK